MRLSRLLVGMILALAVHPAMAADELILGYSMAKTGPFVSIANTNEIAIDMAAEEINANGGVNGRKIKVVKFDTGGDPKQAVTAVRRFARDAHALAVVGPFSSSEAKVAFPIGERLGIVQMPMASSAPGLAAPHRFAFRNTTDEGKVITAVIATIEKHGLAASSAAIAHATDDTVSKAIGTKVLPAVFRNNGIPVKGTVTFPFAAFDLSPQVSQLVQWKPDLIGVGAPPEAAITLAKEMKRQGLSARLIAGTTVADTELPRRMDGAGETMTVGTTFFAGYSDRTEAFAEEFGRRARAAGLPRHEPTQFDASAYDIVYLYAEAMKRAGVTGDPARVAAEREAIRDELAGLEGLSTIEGPISFNEEGDAVKPVYVIEIEDGEWKLLDIATPDKAAR